MTALLTSRRHFLRGLGTIIAAPAIVRVQNIMPVKASHEEWDEIIDMIRSRVWDSKRAMLASIESNMWTSFPNIGANIVAAANKDWVERSEMFQIKQTAGAFSMR